MSSMSTASTDTGLAIRRIRFWQHGRAVGQIFRDYPPGADVIVDQIRSAGFLKRFVLRRVFAPIYFSREQGWAARGARGEMAAIMYLRRGQRRGIRVMHIDDINVGPRHRGHGLGQRLMALAEELARRERRPFLKLAVTVANAPAIALYRRLGYQEWHHHFYTFAPEAAAPRPPTPAGLALRPVRRGRAARDLQRFYRMEVTASQPDVADMFVAYYPLRVPRGAKRMYAIERGGAQLGYGDVHRRDGRWSLDLALRPDVWGTETERQAIQILASAIGRTDGAEVALYVPSAAHFDALRAGPGAPAGALGLVERSHERMLMFKLTAAAH